MLRRVREQRPQYNNDERISSSVTISSIKLLYYQLFAVLYSAAGRCAELAVVNSSWTEGHISELWRTRKVKRDGVLSLFSPLLFKVFPPCNTEVLSRIPIDNKREPIILSIAQFRPEKDHMLQIR